MFPPQIPRFFIEWLTLPGDGVYDPFSGRGTVALETLLAGRTPYVSDANPLAVALSEAKRSVPSSALALRRIDQLRQEYASFIPMEVAPSSIRMLYSQPTLAQILFLKSALSERRLVDRFLRACVLGLLHANHSGKGATRGLSISMPNTFAMSPKYVSTYIRAHRLRRPTVDAFALLEQQVHRLDLPSKTYRSGRAWYQDATKRQPLFMRKRKVRLIFSSPPYLNVIKYAKYNWIRLWFLGLDPKKVDSSLMATASLTRYVSFMRTAIQQLESVLAADGFLCLVVGDVRRGDAEINLANALWSEAAQPLGWSRIAEIPDRFRLDHKVSRIWAENKGRATRTDRILLLTPPGKTVEVPPRPSIDWVTRPTWREV